MVLRYGLPDWFASMEAQGIASLDRSPRARRIRLCAEDLAVRLVVPPRQSLAHAAQFLELNREWVERYAGRAASRRAELTTWNGLIMVDGERALFESTLPKLRKRSAESLLALVTEESRRTGLRPDTVTVRAMKTRWGSCSSRGRVCLNWRLAMAPESVRRYVVVHELAHLAHLDHSPQFWAVVQMWHPEMRAEKAWLRDRGWLLARLPPV
ncbi:MAG: M48 family metallopeptidase [Fimbriimonadaceae bacterium]